MFNEVLLDSLADQAGSQCVGTLNRTLKYSLSDISFVEHSMTYLRDFSREHCMIRTDIWKVRLPEHVLVFKMRSEDAKLGCEEVSPEVL